MNNKEERNKKILAIVIVVALLILGIYKLFFEKGIVIEEYKEKNSITEQNLYSFVTNLNGTSTFKAKKMYEQRLSKSVYKYYVYGYINQEIMDEVTPNTDYYLIVLLDEKNMTFSVEPYDGSMFR